MDIQCEENMKKKIKIKRIYDRMKKFWKIEKRKIIIIVRVQKMMVVTLVWLVDNDSNKKTKL